ncbi:MAG: 4Fe-4S binding protein [Rhodocyclaceae bacterium]
MTSQHQQPPPAHPAESAKPIDALGRIRLAAPSCLALRSGPGACQACITACPSSSIALRNDGFAVNDDCLGCGHCAAVCPSGAITVKGFENLAPLPDGNHVRIECWKVPAALSGHNTIRVPCLGGVSPAQWLGLVEAADQRRVVLVDRGWCAACSAGKHSADEHPATPALDQADAILDELGWAEIHRPTRQTELLPVSLMPASIPAERPASLARRSFFRRLGKEAQRAVGPVETVEDHSPRALRHHDMPLPERALLLAVARRLATAAARPMPATAYVALDVSSSCGHHQLCARLCPTGALSLYERNGTAGLEFDSESCTVCGLCARSCPERAIRILPAAQAPARGQRQPLTAFGERPCARCRTPFSGSPGRTECPECSLSQRLGAALFGGGIELADKPMPVLATSASCSGGVHHE